MASFSSLNDKLDLPLKQYISWRRSLYPLIVSGGGVGGGVTCMPCGTTGGCYEKHPRDPVSGIFSRNSGQTIPSLSLTHFSQDSLRHLILILISFLIY